MTDITSLCGCMESEHYISCPLHPRNATKQKNEEKAFHVIVKVGELTVHTFVFAKNAGAAIEAVTDELPMVKGEGVEPTFNCQPVKRLLGSNVYEM